MAPLPADDAQLLESLKHRGRQAQAMARRRVNTELVRLYWSIGTEILIRQDRQDGQGWGTGVVGRLAEDLRAEFPDMKGLSRSNLFYMRAFATSWPPPVVQQLVGQLAPAPLGSWWRVLDYRALRGMTDRLR
jgi:hypothetical protein